MRKSLSLVALCALLFGCVTINVYFPAAAAQEAAKKVIGDVIGVDTVSAPAPAASAPDNPPAAASNRPANDGGLLQPLAMGVLDALVPVANAAQSRPDLTVSTPAIDAIKARMHSRYQSSLRALLASGAVGLTHNGNVAIRDASKIPLAQRAQASSVVAAENDDRAALYKQMAVANGHPEWASRMREAFAAQWIDMARRGWYYQDASGNWRRK